MARYLGFFFTLLLLSGCFGTEIGNPDARNEDGGGGTGAGVGGQGGFDGAGGGGGFDDGFQIAPTPIDFGTICPGGVGRERIFVSNREPVSVDMQFGADMPVFLEPDFLTVEAWSMGSLAAILRTTGDEAAGPIGGVVLFSLTGVAEEPTSGEIPWTATIAEGLSAKATLLCGDEGPCHGIAAVAWGTDQVRVPFSIVNDGCEDLLLEDVRVDGPDQPAPTQPFPEGEGLPTTLKPGEVWSGQLVFPAASSPAEGQVSPSIRDLPSFSVPWAIYETL